MTSYKNIVIQVKLQERRGRAVGVIGGWGRDRRSPCVYLARNAVSTGWNARANSSGPNGSP